MLSTFCLACLTWFVPPAVATWAWRAGRKDLFRSLPLAVLLHIGFFAALSGLTYRWFPYGWPKWLLLTALSTVLSQLCLKTNCMRAPKKALPPHLLLICLAVALVGTLDLAAIFARQGWHFLPGAPIPGDGTYLRTPFNNDVIRNLMVLNGVLRDADGIILPGTGIKYQAFWFHGAAVVQSLKSPQANFYDIAGFSWAMAILFYFVLGWGLLLWRPSISARAGGAAFLGILLLTDADCYNFLRSILGGGAPGIEADRSFHFVNFFRYMSPKFIVCLAPQHALFFTFLVAFLSVGGRLLEGIFFALSFLTSPIHSVFAFPTIFLYRAILKPRRVPLDLGYFSAGLVSSIVAYLAVLRVSPWSLFSRGVPSAFELFPKPGVSLWYLPGLFVPTLGALGIASLIALWYRLRRREIHHLAMFVAIAVLFVGTHFVLTSSEIRRHATMVGFVLAGFALAAALPAWRLRSRVWLFRPALLGLVALGLHGYFFYCFTGKPSTAPTEIAWKDYFRMNEVLRKRFPKACVIGAVDGSKAIVFPLSSEAVTTLPHPEQGYLLGYLSEKLSFVANRAAWIEFTLPFSKEFGCELALWGPLEKSLWGDSVKARFFAPGNLLARTGEVELYRTEDSLWATLPKTTAGAQEHLAFGHTLAKGDWHREAILHLRRALELDPSLAQAHEDLAKVLSSIGLSAAAVEHQKMARTLRP